MLRLFRKKEKYGGVIKAIGLTDYWEALTEEQRNLFRKWYTAPYQLRRGGQRTVDELDSPKCVVHTGQTASSLLDEFAARAMGNGYNEMAEELLHEALRRSTTVIDEHFVYNRLIDFYYGQRNSRGDALKICEKYCLLDIEIAPKLLRDYDWLVGARFPSFQRLAIIFEKRGHFDEAIEVCKQALALGLHDDTKTNFEGRIERLERKKKR